jgi:signal transduction histidine kinase
VLINLLNNAIKFTDQGGVTLTADILPAWQAAPDTQPRPAARLRITDTGIGIKAEDLAALFRPFHQVDTGLARQHEGTGLGLAICRRLATLMGGDISVTSEWGKGSVFTLTLPLQPAPAP